MEIQAEVDKLATLLRRTVVEVERPKFESVDNAERFKYPIAYLVQISVVPN